MRTAHECIAKAEQMERFAALAGEALMSEEWLVMAAHWRELSQQARWQESVTADRPA